MAAWAQEGRALLVDWAAAHRVQRAALARLDHALDDVGRQTSYDDPLQRPALHCQGLTAKAWHEGTQFPWVTQLENAYERILVEFRRVYSSEGLRDHPESRTLARGGRWRSFQFFDNGLKHEANCNGCPTTAKFISGVAGAANAGLCYFSVADPHTTIAPHFGPHNLRIRCHLGLEVPASCGIKVGGVTRKWQEGKCLLFDDSFLHEVWNKSDDPRAVLIIDVWHPDLSRIETEALGYLFSFWRRGRHLPDDC